MQLPTDHKMQNHHVYVPPGTQHHRMIKMLNRQR